MVKFKIQNFSNQLNLFAIFFIFFIFLFFKLKTPVNSLGIQDGYFYGNMIKSFILDWRLVSLDMQYPSNYPPYFFWALGRVGSLLNIKDLGLLQKYAFLLVIPLFFSLYFMFIKSYFKNSILSVLFLKISLRVTSQFHDKLDITCYYEQIHRY